MLRDEGDEDDDELEGYGRQVAPTGGDPLVVSLQQLVLITTVNF